MRDPILWAGAVLALSAALVGTLSSAPWIGKPFAGFLLLDNRVVPSSGLAHWPAVRGGGLYQHELLTVNGHELESAAALQRIVATLPVGSPVAYTFRSGEGLVERVVATRRFAGLDYLLLFGSFLFCGVGLTGIALAIRFLRPDDPVARGSAVSLWLGGMWALTAADLYGPYHLFRVHAFFDCLIFAGTFHLALVFPSPRRLALRAPWLVPSLYGVAGLLALWNQVGLYEPDAYVRTHRLAVTAFGVAALTLVVSLGLTWLRPPSFAARQRVQILALGSIAALLPQVVLSVQSSLSGGQAPENLMGWSGIFFPLAVAYAVLRHDLLQVDEILRRTVNYAVLTGIVAAGYGVVILAVEPFFQSQDNENSWISALSLAGLLAAVLLPLRDRIQLGVDRIFFRTSYDFRRIVAETSARLAAVNDLSVVTQTLEKVVQQTLSPSSLEFEVADPAAGGLRAPRAGDALLLGARGEPGSKLLESPDGGLCVPFLAEGRLVALMVLGRPLSGRFYDGDDRRFLVTLSNQGAVAIQNALALVSLQDLNATLERKVEERTEELADAVYELKQAQKQMVHQEKMASVGQLVAGVAHEINNPVNFIQGNLFHLRQYVETLRSAIQAYEEAAKDASVGPGLTSRLGEIREELGVDFVLEDLDGLFEGCEEGVRRTTTIVQDLRTFSRLDPGSPTTIDLAAALDATINLLRGRLKGIEVTREYEEVPPVECLEGQLNQVFMNLVANAADAVGDSGSIAIRLRSVDAGTVEVEIDDDGRGIPPDLIEKIFEPFYTTKEVGRGTGLGLAISYEVVAHHGGRIDVASTLGRGTLFRVQLPVEYRGDAQDSGPAG
ncbi:MAG: ATP-binding protein [Myxococcota bacterium]|nr:ATP-binding protein [Myxococcota bacterium]